MDVEIAVPHVPPTLTPGTSTTVPVVLHNPLSAPVSVRLSIGRSRVSDWAVIDPETAHLPPGGNQTVGVVFQPPVGTTVETTLPFTVRAMDALDGSRMGSATGLLHVSDRGRVDATLTSGAPTAAVGRFVLSVQNQGTKAVTLGLAARLEPPGGHAEVNPAIMEVEPGRTGTAKVTAHPRRRLVGARTYGLCVVGRDLSAGGDGRHVVTARADGTAPARTAASAALALLAAVLVAGSLIAWFAPHRLPFRGAATPPHSVTTTATAVAVRRPYVMVDSYPQLDASDRTAAEASLARLTAAGLPVRLIDSKDSADIADGTSGFWVVIRDGFSSVEEADAFCARYRGVTPRCEVVP